MQVTTWPSSPCATGLPSKAWLEASWHSPPLPVSIGTLVQKIGHSACEDWQLLRIYANMTADTMDLIWFDLWSIPRQSHDMENLDLTCRRPFQAISIATDEPLQYQGHNVDPGRPLEPLQAGSKGSMASKVCTATVSSRSISFPRWSSCMGHWWHHPAQRHCDSLLRWGLSGWSIAVLLVVLSRWNFMGKLTGPHRGPRGSKRSKP